MDPGERVYTPRRTRRVALHGVADTRNCHAWDAVLREFLAMGASRADVDADAHRLQYDPDFYRAWASSLPTWCPALARYVAADDE